VTLYADGRAIECFDPQAFVDSSALSVRWNPFLTGRDYAFVVAELYWVPRPTFAAQPSAPHAGRQGSVWASIQAFPEKPSQRLCDLPVLVPIISGRERPAVEQHGSSQPD
jgi:hypothetical protein